MRRLARGVVLGFVLAVAVGFPGATVAQVHDPDFTRSARDLDGAQFLEDEPIWVCDVDARAPSRLFDRPYIQFRLRHVEPGTAAIASRYSPGLQAGPDARAGELVQAYKLPARSELHPLDVGLFRGSAGLSVGGYELLPKDGFGDRTLCRFSVVEPRGSEASVRAALGRAARLADSKDEANLAQAARLYEAVLERYPRTSYVTSIYAGLWRVRAHTRTYASDPSAWLDRIFATFHDTCFGVWALDRFMAEVPAAQARPLLRKLVGLYPDTKLSRAAGAYL